VVKQGIDRELDKIKDRYDGLNSLLRHVALDIAATIPATLDVDVNVIYFPQLGFNIAIPLNDHGGAEYTGSDDDWELMFITENRAYFKDFRMREMDEKLGDIYGIICGKPNKLTESLEEGELKIVRWQRKKSRLCTTWRKGFFDMRMCSSMPLIFAAILIGQFLWDMIRGPLIRSPQSPCAHSGSQLLQVDQTTDG
jgi:hypothetical protein